MEEVKAGPDGCIRTATVRYTNPGGDPHHRSAPKLAIRPIHKLAVIVPVDYQFEEDLATGHTERRGDTKQESTKKKPEGREYSSGPRESGQDSRPKREAAQRAIEALKKGADASRGRGQRKGRLYQRAGTRN